MRFLYIATLIFLFNTAFMPVLVAAHEQSHQAQEGVTQITWSDDQTSAGLFQIVHDEHHAQLESGNFDGHSDHHCHHSPVLGMVGSINTSIATDLKTYNAIESILSLEFFPARIEYPPRNAYTNNAELNLLRLSITDLFKVLYESDKNYFACFGFRHNHS